jgi:hypothetical protein
MNHIQNDRGECIIAVGNPISNARAKIEYPVLIESLDELYSFGEDEQLAINRIKTKGITSKYQIEAILSWTMYRQLELSENEERELYGLFI